MTLFYGVWKFKWVYMNKQELFGNGQMVTIFIYSQKWNLNLQILFKNDDLFVRHRF